MKIGSRFCNVRARRTAFTFGLFLLFGLSGWALETGGPSYSATDTLLKHARYLASKELLGRGVDTPGIVLARDYIAREFRNYGLLPGGDNGTFLQELEVATGVIVKQPATLKLGDETALNVNEEWTPLGLSASGKVEGEVVFAGYGITVKDYGYDDYAGIDATGKVVLVLRYEPPPKNDKSPFQKRPRYSTHAALRTKANNARDHGAIGMILVDLHTKQEGEKELISTTSSLWRGGNRLIAAQIKREFLEKWLARQGVSLIALKEKIDSTETPASLDLPTLKISLEVTLDEVRQGTQNVVAILPGSDPELKRENIVIGAHYDHLGFGHFGTRDSSTEGQIHFGADDNASGTAVLLHLAERLSRANPKPPRTIVFAAFSGEELGLNGSRHFVTHPPFPLSTTKAMLNLDMVGRLRENRLTVFGTRSAKEFSAIVTDAARALPLEIRESDSVGRSDHMSFYNKQIPVLHFFTGVHPDYHRPSDTWEKLNIEGMAKITDLVLATVQKIAVSREPPKFVSLPARAPTTQEGERQGYGTYLGSIPDLSQSAEGVTVAGVTDGSPAAEAGLREGDIIVQFAGTKVSNLEDLFTLLQSKKPGDEVEIVVLRNRQPVSIKAVLRARS